MRPIDALMASMKLKCLTCGHEGPYLSCDCYRECECGWTITKGQECRGPVHSSEGQEFLKNGYWVIDDASGKPYKTGTSSLKIVGQRMMAGTIYGSRKAANAAVRELNGVK